MLATDGFKKRIYVSTDQKIDFLITDHDFEIFLWHADSAINLAHH